MKILANLFFLLFWIPVMFGQPTQLVRNGSMDGPTGDNKAATGWRIVSGTPDCCESDTTTCQKISYKIPVSSPDGGNWARFFNAELGGEPYSEKISNYLKFPILEGKEYQLFYYGAFSPISVGTSPTEAGIIVKAGGFKDTLMLQYANTWVSDTISFIGSSGGLTFEKLGQDFRAACYVDGVSLTCKETDTIYYVHDTLLCSRDLFLLPDLFFEYGPHLDYLWENGDSLYFHIIDTAGVYWVQVPLGCRLRVDTFNVQIYSSDLAMELLSDTLLCLGDTLVLNAKVESPNASYLWSTGSIEPQILVSESGHYSVIVRDSICANSEYSNIQYAENRPLFLDDTLRCIDLPVLLELDSTFNTNYVWSTGDTLGSMVAEEYGIYWAEGTNRCGWQSDTIVLPAPKEFYLGPDTTMCDGDTLWLDASGFFTQRWKVYADGVSYISHNPILAVAESGLYTATVTSSCPHSMEMRESILVDFSSCDPICDVFIPNIFSPNHDSFNDEFKAEFPCPPITYSLVIYDRWGNNVFDSSALNEGWNGEFRNHDLPAGVYIYKLKYQVDGYDEQVVFGDVTLMR